MDGNHATGCSLVGMALTAMLMRLFWMSSPPFSSLKAGRLAAVKIGLVVLAVAGIIAGAVFISQPVSKAVADRAGEEGFRFH